jgi:hypothetical protein
VLRSRLIQGEHHMTHIPRAACPKCHADLMMLTRISFAVSGFEFRTFECPTCEYVHKTLVALVDPMKSEKTGRWLQGELRAPT